MWTSVLESKTYDLTDIELTSNWYNFDHIGMILRGLCYLSIASLPMILPRDWKTTHPRNVEVCWVNSPYYIYLNSCIFPRSYQPLLYTYIVYKNGEFYWKAILTHIVPISQLYCRILAPSFYSSLAGMKWKYWIFQRKMAARISRNWRIAKMPSQQQRVRPGRLRMTRRRHCNSEK